MALAALPKLYLNMIPPNHREPLAIDVENSTAKPSENGVQSFENPIVFVFFTLFFDVITLFGNGLVIVAFIHEPLVRSPKNYYILNLAVSDLIIALVSVPFFTAKYIMKSWPFGSTFCAIWTTIDLTCRLESVYTIVLITHDRFSLVRNPIAYHVDNVKKKVPLQRIILSWLLAAFFRIPFITFSHVYVDRHDMYVPCSPYSKIDAPFRIGILVYDVCFTTVSVLIEYVLPLTVITYWNIQVFFFVRKRSRNVVDELVYRSDEFEALTSANRKVNDNVKNKVSKWSIVSGFIKFSKFTTRSVNATKNAKSDRKFIETETNCIQSEAKSNNLIDIDTRKEGDVIDMTAITEPNPTLSSWKKVNMNGERNDGELYKSSKLTSNGITLKAGGSVSGPTNMLDLNRSVLDDGIVAVNICTKKKDDISLQNNPSRSDAKPHKPPLKSAKSHPMGLGLPKTNNWMTSASEKKKSTLKRCASFPVAYTSDGYPCRSTKQRLPQTKRAIPSKTLSREGGQTMSVSMKKNVRRSAIVLVIIIVQFVFCRTPYVVSRVIVLICHDCVPYVVYQVNFWLGWMLSMFNPFLYAFICAAFKQYCTKLLGHVKRSCKCTRDV